MTMLKKTISISIGFTIFSALSFANSTNTSLEYLKKIDMQPTTNINSPDGYWLLVNDEDTSVAQAMVHIVTNKNKASEDVVSGTLVTPFFKLQDGKKIVPDTLCVACTGEKKNKPIDNLIWGLTEYDKPTRSYGTSYNGGFILDPSNGKEYKVKLYTMDGGKELYVRGYIGMAMFGRTQTWHKISAKQALSYNNLCGIVKGDTSDHYTYSDESGKVTNEKLWNQCKNIQV